MDYGMRLLPALLLLIAANATPVVARRLRLATGTEIPALDQLPEALLPAGHGDLRFCHR
jgi:hypothetical protein